MAAKVVMALGCILSISGRGDHVLFDDSLRNGWQNWSWATVDLAADSPVHAGTRALGVTANNSAGDWQALYLHHEALDTREFMHLSFWIHGGAAGGQSLQVLATLGHQPQPAVILSDLQPNTWRQVSIALSQLGIAAQSNLDGIWIQARGSSPVPAFYVDELLLVSGAPPPPGTNMLVTVVVDVLADRRAINPLIYGVNFASSAQLRDLNVPFNRSGGNATTRYNWQENASNRAQDWYFQSLPESGSGPGAAVDAFILSSREGNAAPGITVPINGWVARLGPGRQRLCSYSIAKYGAQTDRDWQWFADAGNGILASTGQRITHNDPTDANRTVAPDFQEAWIRHLTNRWGAANQGGVRYYFMDNEWGLWHETHRDVHPTGATMEQMRDAFCDHAFRVKSVDPHALVLGPEEWGWTGYFYSGYDAQYGAAHGWSQFPDRAAHGNQDLMPWLLAQIRERSEQTGRRLLDVFTLHFYPQGGEYGSDVSTAMQLRRNRSTRALWDRAYTDATWINDEVMLIPRMRNWATNYPGLLLGITEYDWGAEQHINGATAQADILGIFGREGLDLAARWVVPATGSPVYRAFQLYRNYDGVGSTFGDTSVRAFAPDPDTLSVFAAVRSSDASLTVMLIHKAAGSEAPVRVALTNYPAFTHAEAWQLTSANAITRLAEVAVENPIVEVVLPPQSITLLVVPPETPRIALTRGSDPGQVELSCSCVPGQGYVTLSSTNLLDWTPMTTNLVLEATFSIPVPLRSEVSRYFRVLRSP